MRLSTEQSIPRELVQRLADITTRFVELDEYVRDVTTASRSGDDTPEPKNLCRPIEFQTENGFAIMRSWEIGGSPVPTCGSFCFYVRDPAGEEHEVTIEIAGELIAETAFSSRGRIQYFSLFWICCAERELADFIDKHEHTPPDYKLTLEALGCEEVMLSLRWEGSDL